jgi:hypothetical protein
MTMTVAPVGSRVSDSPGFDPTTGLPASGYFTIIDRTSRGDRVAEFSSE